MQLRFSPCKQVLVSCAGQLCFWNVKHMRNNQATPEVRSRRHYQTQPQLSTKGREEVDAARFLNVSMEQSYNDLSSPQCEEFSHVTENKACLWADKRGNDKLPELLACIKFVGNEARHFYASVDFTQFYVIDDEGVFYHLKVLENSPAQSLRVLDHVPDIRLIEQRQTLLDEPQADDNDNEVDDNNDGVDVVGSGDILPDRQPDQI